MKEKIEKLIDKHEQAYKEAVQFAKELDNKQYWQGKKMALFNTIYDLKQLLTQAEEN